MEKKFIVGSRYFFDNIEGFKSKDTDTLILVDEPKGFRNIRQINMQGRCIFMWRRMSPEEFIDISLNSKLGMNIGKFLIPEVCNEIGFTLEHLSKLSSMLDILDNKHKYERIIYDAYMENKEMTLTDEQRMKAFEEYKKYRNNNI